ncbi:MAG: glycosyltransferase family 39 protein [Saprospiraceae bacterium]|nr:glycosyltransferase family 39 protein [Saprospiraceae bacterium]
MARKPNGIQETRKKTAANPPVSSAQATSASYPVSQRSHARRSMLVLFLLLATGALLRLLNLSALSLWMDEYVHVMRAKNFLEQGGPLLTDDNNGILLTVLLLPGFSLLDTSAFWARLPGALFGIALLWLVYRAGCRFFNRYVGLLAAGGATFSLFLIFWSRMCRNYAILAFFFLLLGLVFWAAFETRERQASGSFWARQGIDGRYLAALPLVGLLALLAHQLTFFFVFTLAAYALIRLAQGYLGGEARAERPKYAWLAGLTAPFLLLVTVPMFGAGLKTLLSPFFLSDIAEWAIPDWSRLAGLTAEKPFESFEVYESLLRYDLNWFYVPALAGLLIAAWRYPRAGAWLLASFVVPLLLLSFVFREPFLRRYLIFAYPYVLLGMGVFFYAAWEWLKQKYWPKASPAAAYAFFTIPFGLLLGNAHWNDIADLALARTLEGHIVDTRIANWSFTNWKEASAYVARKRQPGDLILSTVPTAASYYLDTQNVLWFRQSYYDTHQKRYIFNTPNPSGGPSAATLEDLMRTVRETPRGWLLADYYLENIFTDERALLWVYQNMHYYPEASSDGSVMVFGWDHSQPAPTRQNLVVELGRDNDKIESKEYQMVLPQGLFSGSSIDMTVRTRWIDTNREALILFNGENAVWLPPNRGPGIEEAVLSLDKSWVRPGPNTIRVLYEPKRPSDPRKGFTLYFLSLQEK